MRPLRGDAGPAQPALLGVALPALLPQVAHLVPDSGLGCTRRPALWLRPTGEAAGPHELAARPPTGPGWESLITARRRSTICVTAAKPTTVPAHSWPHARIHSANRYWIVDVGSGPGDVVGAAGSDPTIPAG